MSTPRLVGAVDVVAAERVADLATAANLRALAALLERMHAQPHGLTSDEHQRVHGLVRDVVRDLVLNHL